MKKSKDLGLLKKVQKQERFKGGLQVLEIILGKLGAIQCKAWTFDFSAWFYIPKSLPPNLVILEVHSNCSGKDPEDAGTSLNQATFKRHFVN